MGAAHSSDWNRRSSSVKWSFHWSDAVAPADQAAYDPDEERSLRERYAAGEPPHCPRDGAAMTVRKIGGGSFGLGYARRRQWLLCPVCRRSVIFDRERGTRL
jgi:hypothetical protein